MARVVVRLSRVDIDVHDICGPDDGRVVAIMRGLHVHDSGRDYACGRG